MLEQRSNATTNIRNAAMEIGRFFHIGSKWLQRSSSVLNLRAHFFVLRDFSSKYDESENYLSTYTHNDSNEANDY